MSLQANLLKQLKAKPTIKIEYEFVNIIDITNGTQLKIKFERDIIAALKVSRFDLQWTVDGLIDFTWHSRYLELNRTNEDLDAQLKLLLKEVFNDFGYEINLNRLKFVRNGDEVFGYQ